MRHKDVPQDRRMTEGSQEVCYAVDENGQYVLVPSTGWEPKTIANDQAWELIHEQVADILFQVQQGQVSLLAYHMTKNLMDISLLAQYAGFSRWRVWWHMRPWVFKRLKAPVLMHYARV
ncbi:MAG: hypothetical protein MUP25_03735, partial [Syntrophales bacterium]|nr:hypothetical protein [Syntrophales bacterium]